jgi:hypothetical protein
VPGDPGCTCRPPTNELVRCSVQSNSPRRTPARNAAHSLRVKPTTEPCGCLESRIQTCSPARATSTQPLAPLALLLRHCAAMGGGGTSTTPCSSSCRTAHLPPPVTTGKGARQQTPGPQSKSDCGRQVWTNGSISRLNRFSDQLVNLHRPSVLAVTDITADGRWPDGTNRTAVERSETMRSDCCRSAISQDASQRNTRWLTWIGRSLAVSDRCRYRTARCGLPHAICVLA